MATKPFPVDIRKISYVSDVKLPASGFDVTPPATKVTSPLLLRSFPLLQKFLERK